MILKTKHFEEKTEKLLGDHKGSLRTTDVQQAWAAIISQEQNNRGLPQEELQWDQVQLFCWRSLERHFSKLPEGQGGFG